MTGSEYALTSTSYLLLAEDDAGLRQQLARSFARKGVACEIAGSLAEAKKLLLEKTFSHAVLDLFLGDGSGIDLVDDLVKKDTSVVVMTGFGNAKVALQAVAKGARSFLSKPASIDQIEEAFAKGLEGLADVKTANVPVPSLDQVESEYLSTVLTTFDGNITQSAKALGLHRQALQRKLKKLKS